MDTDYTPMESNNQKRGLKNDVFDLVRFTLITLAVVIPIRIFIAQPFIVNGESMLPNLHNGDYLIIDEVSYHKHDPERGDVIVFKFPTNLKRFLIKRVIGLPGETISIQGSTITITKPDGEIIQLEEDYLNGDFSSHGEWNLADDEFFVLGDNRSASSDSRTWGVLRRHLIVGKTFLRLFPLSKISFHPAEQQARDIEVVK